MGKCGARELNYASDVDVIFVAADAGRGGGRFDRDYGGSRRCAPPTQLAAGLIRVCSQSTPEGALFPVDPNLRPEGRQGPLVRTLASHLAYYERWAKTWEFQALLKARPVAGDLGPRRGVRRRGHAAGLAGRRSATTSSPTSRRCGAGSWTPARRAGRPGDQARPRRPARHRVRRPAAPARARPGRRDAARARPRCPRSPPWRPGGYVGRARRGQPGRGVPASCARSSTCSSCTSCAAPTRCPTDAGRPAPDRPRPARMAGGDPGDPADALLAAMAASTPRRSRQLHEKLFYRPLLDAVARLPGEATRLTPVAARARLEALGYADPAGALRHIEALTSGVSRKAAIQRTLLPVMLGWFADAPEPDAGLLGVPPGQRGARRTRPGTCGCSATTTAVAQRMARLLGLQPVRHRPAAARAGRGRHARRRRAAGGAPAAALAAEADATVRRHDRDAEAAVAARARAAPPGAVPHRRRPTCSARLDARGDRRGADAPSRR